MRMRCRRARSCSCWLYRRKGLVVRTQVCRCVVCGVGMNVLRRARACKSATTRNADTLLCCSRRRNAVEHWRARGAGGRRKLQARLSHPPIC